MALGGLMPDCLFFSHRYRGQAITFGYFPGSFRLGLGFGPVFRWSGAAPDPARSRQVQGKFPAHAADGFL